MNKTYVLLENARLLMIGNGPLVALQHQIWHDFLFIDVNAITFTWFDYNLYS